MTLYTPEDLLQYLYKETSPQQTIAIESALKDDWALREKLAVIQSSVQDLNAAVEIPRTEIVLKVLNYARETMVQPA